MRTLKIGARNQTKLAAPFEGGGIAHVQSTIPAQGIHGSSLHDQISFSRRHMPSIAQIGGAVEKSFVMEDWHLIGPDYDRTLMAWFENFNTGWDQLKAKYGERFYRLWKYYLLYCAGSFQARHVRLWQNHLLEARRSPGSYRTIW